MPRAAQRIVRLGTRPAVLPVGGPNAQIENPFLIGRLGNMQRFSTNVFDKTYRYSLGDRQVAFK